MLNDIQPEEVPSILVQYFGAMPKQAPDEIVVVRDQHDISQVMALLHRLPEEGDVRLLPELESEYLVIALLDEESAQAPAEAIDPFDHLSLEFHSGRLQSIGGLSFSGEEALSIQRQLYDIISQHLTTMPTSATGVPIQASLHRAQRESSGGMRELLDEVSALLAHRPGSAEWILSESRVSAAARALEGQVSDLDIPALLLALEALGGSAVAPQVIRTLGSLGSPAAFDAVLEALRNCTESGRTDAATANACLEVLDRIDSERAAKEDVYALMELANL